MDNISDHQIQERLVQLNFPMVPVTNTTRKLLINKLQQLDPNMNNVVDDEIQNMAGDDEIGNLKPVVSSSSEILSSDKMAFSSTPINIYRCDGERGAEKVMFDHHQDSFGGSSSISSIGQWDLTDAVASKLEYSSSTSYFDLDSYGSIPLRCRLSRPPLRVLAAYHFDGPRIGKYADDDPIVQEADSSVNHRPLGVNQASISIAIIFFIIAYYMMLIVASFF